MAVQVAVYVAVDLAMRLWVGLGVTISEWLTAAVSVTVHVVAINVRRAITTVSSVDGQQFFLVLPSYLAYANVANYHP